MVPGTVFVVPYRNRVSHRVSLLEAMDRNLADWEQGSFRIMFIHQCDKHPFNRGAMKNIGYLVVKDLFPAEYHDITIVFHDVDTWPAEKGLVSYSTKKGVVAHFYGFEFALGGIVAIKGGDFEKANGFPNLWGWGIEDNTLNDRCKSIGLLIDRTNFYHVRDSRIIRADDGKKRIVSIRDPTSYHEGSLDGIRDVRNVAYDIVEDMVNVTSFTTGTNPDNEIYRVHDTSTQSTLYCAPACRRRTWSMNIWPKLS